MENAKRLRRVYVGKDLILTLLNWRVCEYIALPDSVNLPDGYAIVQVDYSITYDGFIFLVEHESFDPVYPGYEIPWHNDRLQWGTRVFITKELVPA